MGEPRLSCGQSLALEIFYEKLRLPDMSDDLEGGDTGLQKWKARPQCRRVPSRGRDNFHSANSSVKFKPLQSLRQNSDALPFLSFPIPAPEAFFQSFYSCPRRSFCAFSQRFLELLSDALQHTPVKAQLAIAQWSA